MQQELTGLELNMKGCIKMKYCKGLGESIIEQYENTRINNPRYFGEWFITCKENYSFANWSTPLFVAGETYRIHDKAYDLWGAVSYEISGHMLSWVKWEDLLKYFNPNEEVERFIKRGELK